MITRVSSVGSSGTRAGPSTSTSACSASRNAATSRWGPDGRWVEVAPPGAETAVVLFFTPGLVFACDDLQQQHQEGASSQGNL